MTGYTRAQIALHWITAVLVVAAWITHEDMGKALRGRLEGAEGTPLHVWFGVAVFFAVLVRLALRRRHGAPPPVPGMPPLLEAAATWGHRALYALLVATPAAGMATWFGGFLEAGEFHEALGNALMLLALVHAAAALWHHFGRRDETLRRMLRPAR